MRISVWLVSMDRRSWITAGELLILAIALVSSASGIPLALGLLLLAHVGYQALTGLPIGAIPGAPPGTKRHRRNQDLRTHVVGFLNEVRRVEEYAQRARVDGRPRAEIEATLRAAQERVTEAAAEVVKVVGRSTE